MNIAMTWWPWPGRGVDRAEHRGPWRGRSVSMGAIAAGSGARPRAPSSGIVADVGEDCAFL